jgi:hypothetical protein
MRYGAGMTAIALALSGCVSVVAPESAPEPVAAAAAPYPVERLVGAWGVASYRDEKDRARTEAQARTQCKLPYVIKRGPTDGVTMHVADDATPHELTLKRAGDGRVYLGFAGLAGDAQDREIVSMSEKMFVARYVDADTNTRYGTLIYVRCAKG